MRLHLFESVAGIRLANTGGGPGGSAPGSRQLEQDWVGKFVLLAVIHEDLIRDGVACENSSGLVETGSVHICGRGPYTDRHLCVPVCETPPSAAVLCSADPRKDGWYLDNRAFYGARATDDDRFVFLRSP